jgi:hypothetical protein
MALDELYDSGTGFYDSGVDTYDGSGITSYAIFTPPLVCDTPPFLPDTPFSPALSLFRHYTPRCRGVNVAILSDGTVVQDTATAENGNTNWPYPWNPYEPAAPYARVYSFKGVESDYYITPYIVTVFYGGHDPYPIDQPTYQILLHAGYADRLVASS